MAAVGIAVAGASIAGCGDTTPSDDQVGPRGEPDPPTKDAPADDQKRRRNTVELKLEPLLPSRTITYRDPRQRVHITFPADWYRAEQSLTPRLAKPGGILAVGTFPLRPEPGKACSGAPDLPQVEIGPNDALVHLEVQPDEHSAAARRRGPRFHLLEQVRPVEPARPASGQVFPWNCLNRVGIVGIWDFFGADRRVFYVTAVAGEETSRQTRRTVLGVLQSLRFG